jgi:hypothetical protein
LVEVKPGPQALVQLFQRQRLFAVQVVQELFAHRPKEPFDLPASFGLIGRSMNDEHADGGGDARQLRAAVDLSVIHIQPHRDTARGDGLAQAVQANVQTFAGIELGVRDEPTGVIEDGMQQGLHLAAARALNIRTIEHVRLPDLVGEFGFELLACRRSEQLAFGESALLEEAIQGGGGDGGFVLAGQSQLPQQGGAGAVRVFALETLDEVSKLRRDGAGLPAVLPWLRRQRLEAAVAVAQRPVQQRVYGNRGALGSGNLVVAGGNLFGAAGEFTAR